MESSIVLLLITDVNVAFGKPALQISEGWQGVPSNAVDGDRDNIYWDLSCQHTQKQPNPWLVVDLEQDFDIARVTMVNRGDCCR